MHAIAAPVPQRTNSDLFHFISASLKSTPSPLLRQSSPHLTAAQSNSPNPTNIVKLQQSCTFDNDKLSASSSPHCEQNGVSETYAHLSEYSALPFLGEQLSVHNGTDFFQVEHGRLATGLFGMPRAQSLETLSKAVSRSPCMSKMPISRSYTELGDSFEAISSNSWMLPYIIACCPSFILHPLLSLPPLLPQEHNDNLVQSAYIKNKGMEPVRDTEEGINKTMSSFYHHQSYSSRPPFASASPGPLNTSASSLPVAKSMDSVHSLLSLYPENRQLFFPPSWRSLGILLLSKDPSWRAWEPKHVLLIDNYLFECTADGASVIGYAQLSDASISKCAFTDPHGRTNSNNITSTASRGTNGGKSQFIQKMHLGTGLVISYHVSPMDSGAIERFWITTESMHYLDVVAGALLRASKLQVEDIFDFPNDAHGQPTVLGRGKTKVSSSICTTNCLIIIHRSLQRSSSC
jgi:hypothetical protein